VDQLEREVESLRRISMHDWNATEGGSLYKVFGTAKKWPDAEASFWPKRLECINLFCNKNG
jgi:hypothetical protein